MEEQKIINLVVRKSNWIVHILYWIVAASLMFFIFGNRNYDLNIRWILVSYITIISYIVTRVINYYLIPGYLFKGKFWTFIYLIFGVFIVNLWLIVYSTILILIYSMSYLPQLVLPQKDDILILVSGSFLVIILAAVIHFIKESYRRYLEKNTLEKQKQLTEIKLKDAKLKLLQAQIHPHFLFNMLNNLYGLVNESVDNSRDVIMKLSELLDYMLYECNKPKVSLNKEIRFINNYIELERIRHDEHFNVKTSFPNLNEDILIAPLILFPFIENAFKHGFQDSGNSFINIQLSADNNCLELLVDNSLNQQTKDKYLMLEGKGIGLKNIQERLELIYKDKYQLDIFNKENTFVVKLEINLE
ncbi:MAG: sensor histidine kinase [Candidatus Muiribacteriota bacterium]